MPQVEEVRDGAQEGNRDGDIKVEANAARAADVKEVEIERVNEEGHEAGDEEDPVPAEDGNATGVEYVAGFPWPLRDLAEERRGGQREVDLRSAEEERKETGGCAATGPHRPRRRSNLCRWRG